MDIRPTTGFMFSQTRKPPIRHWYWKVHSRKNADDTGSTIYYPIIINKSQSGTTITGASGTGTSNIARNTTYSIKATIKSIGITDPMEDITPTSLQLTVSVADWALNITQDVTFE